MNRQIPVIALAFAAFIFAGAAAAQAVLAQSYPARPIRVVVPFPPGGPGDIVTRIIAQKLQESWGQPVVVENKSGASGIVGTEITAKAAPDGYTLIMGSIGTHAINVSLYKKLAYDPVKDFAPISQVALLPLVLLVHPSIPANSVKELIALAKEKPRALNFSSAGAGGSMHVAAELFMNMTGAEMVHIPYKGASPALADLLSGQVALSFVPALGTLPHVKSGRVRALAVTTVARTIAYPDLPTVSEAGVPGYESISWLGLLAPAGTPKEIVNKICAEVQRIIGLPEVKERLLAQGAEPIGTSPEQFAIVLQSDIAKYARIIKESGYKAE